MGHYDVCEVCGEFEHHGPCPPGALKKYNKRKAEEARHEQWTRLVDARGLLDQLMLLPLEERRRLVTGDSTTITGEPEPGPQPCNRCGISVAKHCVNECTGLRCGALGWCCGQHQKRDDR